MFLYFLFGFILGATLGSFVKALADRSLNRVSFWGRSYCPHCKKNLSWYDLIPMVSYLLLKGKCRRCHKKIGLEYLLIEFVLGIIVGYLFWQTVANFPVDLNIYNLALFGAGVIFKIFVIVVLVVVFITDIKKNIIPDRVILPSIAISIIFLISISTYKIWVLYLTLSQTSLGKLLLPPKNDYFTRHVLTTVSDSFFSFLIMGFLIGAFFLGLIILTRGKGMGGGDFKLGIFLGLAFGFPNSILCLMLSFLMGSLVGIILVILGKKKFGQTIPFGPFLSLGGLITIFWGERIIDWYLALKLVS